MRFLSRLFLIVCLLAGLAAAPAATLAAPQGHHQLIVATGSMDMHAGHSAMRHDTPGPASPSHHGKDAAACAAWCAGAFLTVLQPRPDCAVAMPSVRIDPARFPTLSGLALAPPLQPPNNMLS
jgi:hypothetical protein